MSTPGRYGDGRGGHGLSLLPQDVPAAVAAIRAGTASAAVRLAVEFILTGCRSGEARHATWDTIDNDTWTLPGERTKTGKPNRIPLSRRAPEVLAEARRLGDGTGLVFGVARTGRPLLDNTLGKALRSAEIPATVDAMRASLRDWPPTPSGRPPSRRPRPLAPDRSGPSAQPRIAAPSEATAAQQPRRA